MGMQIPKTIPTTLSLEVDDPTDPSSTTNCDSATDIPAISPLLITSLRAWSWSAASADPGSADGAALPSKSTEPSLIELHVIAFVLPLTAPAKTLKNLKKFKLKVLMIIMSLILKVNLNLLPHFHPKNLYPSTQLVQKFGVPEHVRHGDSHLTHSAPPALATAFYFLVYPAAHVRHPVSDKQVLH